MKRTVYIFGLVMAASLAQGSVNQPGVSPGPGMRYATDAYPGFDDESEIVAASKKEPKWFSWINGPVCANPKDQLDYCEKLLMDHSDSKAAKQLDALVREWPISPEAPIAQKRLAEVLLVRLGETQDAFDEYRYLVDFYSLSFDFASMIDKMHEIAEILRLEGKTIVFFRFDNTVDVRRAYEACVLRAPGAKWVPDAMLKIAMLRTDEGKYEDAVRVYENLRSLHGSTPEARRAFLLEGRVRMKLLRDHGYNRTRCNDTIAYLKLALRHCEDSAIEEIKTLLAEANEVLEGEAYRAAVFYDSPTRTVRSAVNAYEKFLAEYPSGVYAERVQARLDQLRAKKESE